MCPDGTPKRPAPRWCPDSFGPTGTVLPAATRLTGVTDETVLITGGTGFIGAYTAREILAETDAAVVAFDLDTDPTTLERLGVADRVQRRRGDVTDAASVFRAVRETGATRIVHLAALLTTTTRADPRAGLDVNVVGTNNVLEAARTFDDQVERVAWASSSAVYAPPAAYEGQDEVDEDDLLRPATLYGAAKAYNERQAEVYREEFGVSHVGLRPTLVYGPYREAGSASTFTAVVEKPARGDPVEVGPADHLFDWQHAADAAQAFRRAAFAPDDALSRRWYNVCGERATLREVAAVVRNLLPDAEITLTDTGDSPWTHTMRMDAAREDLGYQPTYDLRSGVRHYVEVVRREAGLSPVED